MLEIGSVLDGKYKILNVIGRGGMSVVYLAMNEKANKQWAIKEVRKDGVKDFDVVKQSLVAETDMLKRLDHPNLPSIVDVIEDDERFLIVMDYVQGNSLSSALEEYGAQPQELVIEWAKQLCDVLGYLHTRQPAIIYRDMKPSNVMLKPDGKVTLIDFGTAREFKERNVADTTCLGTIGYAAPEQFGGMGQTDGRTDIYCLGATLYHLVTGFNPCEPPYEIRPIREINPGLSSGLEKILLKCTKPDPNERYQTAAELMYDLEHYEEIDDMFRKRQKKKLAAFAAMVCVTVACGATAAWGKNMANANKVDIYESYINDAANISGDNERQIEIYMKAIAVDPTRETAYLKIIENIYSDSIITPAEKMHIDDWTIKMTQNGELGSYKSIVPIDELKKNNSKGYEEVCYKTGSAIMYAYDVAVDLDRYKQAENWYERIKDTNDMANAFCKLIDCKERIGNISAGGREDQATEEYDTYVSLWTELCDLYDDLDKNGGNYSNDNLLVAYKQLVKFMSEGIFELVDKKICTKEDLNAMFDNISNSIEKCRTDYNGESIEKIQDMIKEAKLRVNTLQENKKGSETENADASAGLDETSDIDATAGDEEMKEQGE